MTVEQIETALEEYREGQTASIRQMAAERGLDPNQLTPALYKRLIMEEAEFSMAASGPDPEEQLTNQQYAANLKRIADTIN